MIGIVVRMVWDLVKVKVMVMGVVTRCLFNRIRVSSHDGFMFNIVAMLVLSLRD